MLDKALRMALACLLGASLSMSILVRQLNAQVLYGSVTGTGERSVRRRGAHRACYRYQHRDRPKA
jgi:hypothetical protein